MAVNVGDHGVRSPAFQHPYRGCRIVFGRGATAGMEDVLADRGRERALVVCGSTVATNDEVIGPVRDGLGERFVDVWDGTTPAKRAANAFELIDVAAETGIDAFVAVGGGSSLDVARQASAFSTDGRSLADLRREATETGRVRPPDPSADRPAVIVVPTTFAGADLADGGSIEVLTAAESPTGQPVTVSGSAMPVADVLDPDLFETTPTSVLAGSAMNGLDKGIETCYARTATPISDATAVHGLRYLSEALPAVVEEDSNPAAMDRAVAGAVLVQLDRGLSIVHAFGHGFARRYDVQQGAVHAVVVPHVLRYLFEHADGNRSLLANGFGVATPGQIDAEVADAEVAEAVVDAVISVRDALGLPTRLRDLPETRREDLPAIASFVVDDPIAEHGPEELPVTAEAVEAVLDAAW